MLAGLDNIYLKPGIKMLYLGAASGAPLLRAVSPRSQRTGCTAPASAPPAADLRPSSLCPNLPCPSGTSVSHCSDIVGPEGAVYAVEFSHRSGRDLVNMAKKRPNVVPIIEDARHPMKYRMLVPMVDVVFADVAQPDQARIVALNAQYFLKQVRSQWGGSCGRLRC